ncbi:MAG: NlpC/P60 family protein [candidate division Zixibacteria bacterium]|nr:NlpC/P60 family protein [candidate division Zixibacteria bacterium]
MKIAVGFFSIVVIIFVSCTSYPRYRTGGAELPATVAPQGINWNTSEYVKLGLIFEEYLGKPYAGKSLYEPGIDCSLFTQEVYSQYNDTKLPRKVKDQIKVGTKITRNLIRYGDLVFFRTSHNYVSHVGISVGHNQFIHASLSQGVMISSLLEKYWSQRYIGARRIVE